MNVIGHYILHTCSEMSHFSRHVHNFNVAVKSQNREKCSPVALVSVYSDNFNPPEGTTCSKISAVTLGHLSPDACLKFFDSESIYLLILFNINTGRYNHKSEK